MKRIIITLCFIVAIAVNAMATFITVNVKAAGSIAYELKKICDWTEIDSIKVTGTINGRDFYEIRKMANGFKYTSYYYTYVNGNLTHTDTRLCDQDGRLIYADLGDADVVMAETEPDTCLNCNDLKELILPRSMNMRYVSNNTFTYCLNLEKLTLPDSVRTFGLGAFVGKDIFMTTIEGDIESKAHSYRKTTPKLKSVNWENVTSINDYAISDMYYLKFDKFPSNLKNICTNSIYFSNRQNVESSGLYPEEINLTDARIGESGLHIPGLKRINAVYTGNYSKAQLFNAFSGVGAESITLVDNSPYRGKGKTILTGYDFGGNSMTDLSVDVITPNMARNCPNLESITFKEDFCYGRLLYCINPAQRHQYTSDENTIHDREFDPSWFNGSPKVKFYGPEYDPKKKNLMTLNGAVYNGESDGPHLCFVPRCYTTFAVPETCAGINDGALDGCELTDLYLGNIEYTDSFITSLSENTNLTFGEKSNFYTADGILYRKSDDGTSPDKVLRCKTDKYLGETYRISHPFYKEAYLGTHPELKKVIVSKDVTDVSYLFPEAENLRVIEFESTTPPAVTDVAGTITQMQTHAEGEVDCYISVPEGYGAFYYVHPLWGKFDIREYDASIGIITTDRVTISTEGNTISLIGFPKDCRMDVVNLAGQTVYSGTEHSVVVPTSGVYIVHAFGASKKVIVK